MATAADERAAARTLLLGARWAALATVSGDGAPLASCVAYALEPGAARLLLHLSRLAEHTRNLLERPRASLVVSEVDDAREDPQTLARLSLGGTARILGRDTAEWRAARGIYLERFPGAAPRFAFADFELVALAPARAYWVGGFGRARRLRVADLLA